MEKELEGEARLQLPTVTPPPRVIEDIRDVCHSIVDGEVSYPTVEEEAEDADQPMWHLAGDSASDPRGVAPEVLEEFCGKSRS